MKTFVKLAACAAALLAANACGDDRGSDGLSADDRDRLNALAESQDLNTADVVDTSPDSLVPANGALTDEGSEASEGDAGPAPDANAVLNGQ